MNKWKFQEEAINNIVNEFKSNNKSRSLVIIPTGGGKTLAQYWGQSIYGNPDKLHFAAKYTQNSLFSRL